MEYNSELINYDQEADELDPKYFDQDGTWLGDLVLKKDLKIDSSAAEVLTLALEQNNYLNHVKVVFVSPEVEPDTAGFFNLVETDENLFIPTVFIVSEDKAHLTRLLEVRKSSSKRTAERLGISLEEMTPDLLRKFIITHELGHATDYIKNYESNPEYQGREAVDEWNMHYDANLINLPCSGLDPVELMEKISEFRDLDEFLADYPEVAKKINPQEIKTLADLLVAQENAYRSSIYEKYADDFAADFLIKNAANLAIDQLLKGSDIKNR